MGKKFIQAMDLKKGALRKTLGIKKGKTIPSKKLAEAAKGIGVSKKTEKRAETAETLKKLSKRRKK